jgi:hypothetical protein
MAKVSLKQEVQLFKNDDLKGMQTVTLATDPNNNFWLNVNHNGQNLALSLENWEKLSHMVNNAKKILKVK